MPEVRYPPYGAGPRWLRPDRQSRVQAYSEALGHDGAVLELWDETETAAVIPTRGWPGGAANQTVVMPDRSRRADLGPVAPEIAAHYEAADEARRLETGLGEEVLRLVERTETESTLLGASIHNAT